MERRINGHTGLLALFGTPVGHSGSPAMYNFSFQHDGLDYAYMAFDVNVEQMPAVFDSIRLFNMRGGNFTMPCKNIAAELVDKLSPAAEIIGACNVFVNDAGVITGHITDGVGFVKNLEVNGVDVKGKKIACVLSGGNIDVSFIHRIIELGLVTRERKLKFKTTLLDIPGSLEHLSHILAEANANIVMVQHDRLSAELDPNEAIIHIACEVGGREHGERVIKVLEKNGYNIVME